MVYHLLTHTSGWCDDDHVAARDAELDEAIATIPEGTDPLTHIMLWPGWDVPRRLPAGERMQYCNFNYSLLGEIVRRVTGGTLDAAMRRYLFEPIGMTSSAVIVDDDAAAPGDRTTAGDSRSVPTTPRPRCRPTIRCGRAATTVPAAASRRRRTWRGSGRCSSTGGWSVTPVC